MVIGSSARSQRRTLSKRTATLPYTAAMGSASSIVKSAIRAATSAPVSGVAVGGDLLIAIISLSEAVAQKRHYPFRSVIKSF